MTRTCSVLALFLPLSLALPAAAATPINGVGFQCTNDPQYRVWFHSFAHAPSPVTQTDATALAQNICRAQFNGTPVNAKVTFADGSNLPVSATAVLPTNWPPAKAESK